MAKIVMEVSIKTSRWETRISVSAYVAQDISS